MRRAGFGIFMVIMGMLMVIPTIVKHIEFKQNCSGYLKQAADASTIATCKERLDIAIEYIEVQRWTYGYTSVLYKTEDENVGYWYNNLKNCQQILAENRDAESLVQSNVLMRVRECLTDNGEKGTTLTIPNGLCYYPNNIDWGFYRLFILLIFVIGAYCIFTDDNFIW